MSETVSEQQASELDGLEAVLAGLGAAMAEQWPQLDLSDLAGSMDAWLEATIAVVQQYAEAAAVLAVEVYEQMRAEAGIESEFVPELTLPEPEQIERNLRWAVTDAPDQTNRARMLDRVEQSTQRLVTNAARDTIAETTESDEDAEGWARIPRPNACAFCLLLATRGAVYTSQTAATAAGGVTGYHDHCRCTAVPVFSGQSYDPPDHLERWDELYRDAARGHDGTERLRAFARAVYAERNR